MSATTTDAPKPNFLFDIINTIQRQEKVKKSFQPADQKKVLLERIHRWKLDSIGKIEAAATDAIADVEKSIQETSDQFTMTMSQVETEVEKINQTFTCDQKNLDHLKHLLDLCEQQISSINALKHVDERAPLIHGIALHKGVGDATKSRVEAETRVSGRREETERSSPASSGYVTCESPTRDPSGLRRTSSIPRLSASSSHAIIVADPTKIPKKTEDLFKKLDHLLQTSRHELTDRDFANETDAMERFLRQEFGYVTVRDQCIAEDIEMFQIFSPPGKQNPKKMLRFSNESTTESFSMTIEEIVQWQKTYAVYAQQSAAGMTKDFIRSALKGESNDGQEASRMKFLVTTSTCPILMDFDGRVITRSLDEDWPNRIKMIRATGINFAGQKRDANDIVTYISNWRDVFELDPLTGGFLVNDDRVLLVKADPPKAQLNQKLLQDDLVAMARLRLQACDREKVQIVIETGIGLGVFSGARLGIDEPVRKASAAAIRQVLETDGSSYKNICAVVFSLPIRSPTSHAHTLSKSVHETFIDAFSKDNYSGSIPVMIIDQDIHPLALQIARAGFCVSELKPSDSLGVFGGYWKTIKSSFSGKLVVTTLGLLVQHHLINESVLDTSRYHLV